MKSRLDDTVTVEMLRSAELSKHTTAGSSLVEGPRMVRGVIVWVGGMGKPPPFPYKTHSLDACMKAHAFP